MGKALFGAITDVKKCFDSMVPVILINKCYHEFWITGKVLRIKHKLLNNNYIYICDQGIGTGISMKEDYIAPHSTPMKKDCIALHSETIKQDYIAPHNTPIKEDCIAPIKEDYIAPHSEPMKEDYIEIIYDHHFDSQYVIIYYHYFDSQHVNINIVVVLFHLIDF